jgi:hypothetical protein
MGYLMTALSGLSVGSLYAKHYREGTQFVEAGRHYSAALYQWAQLTNVLVIISRLGDKVLSQKLSIPLKIVRNVLPIAAIPLCLIIASSKSGNYPQFAERWNRYIPIALPTTLSERVQAICEFLAVQGDRVMRAVILVGIVALHALGDTTFAKAAIAGIVYEALDHRGYIRQDISAFVDKYMTFVNLIVGSYSGILVNCLINIVVLPFHLFTKTNEIFQSAIGRFLTPHVTISGHSLEALNAPVQDRKQMPYAEIMNILNTPLGTAEDLFRQFEIDPAHCTKWNVDLTTLERQDDPDQLLQMWDAYSNQEKIDISLNRILEDEHLSHDLLTNGLFFDPLSLRGSHLPDLIRVLRDDLGEREEIDQYALTLATRNLEELVTALKGQGSIRGSYENLSKPRENISYLIPHLRRRSPQGRLESLFKLAMPVSGFTPLGVKESAQKLFHDYLLRLAVAEEEGLSADQSFSLANIDYETGLKRALLERRLNIVHQHASPQAVSPQAGRGVRLQTQYLERSLSRGFLPSTPSETSSVDMMVEELFDGPSCEPTRRQMQQQYLLTVGDTLIQHNGQVIVGEGVFGPLGFGQYFQQLLNNNTQLTDAQRQELQGLFSREYNNNPLSRQNFQRLVLVMLGVVRVRPPQGA